jgi:hypothetical protein
MDFLEKRYETGEFVGLEVSPNPLLSSLTILTGTSYPSTRRQLSPASIYVQVLFIVNHGGFRNLRHQIFHILLKRFRTFKSKR